MLPLILMLVADPLTAAPAAAPAGPPSVRIIDADATMRSVDQAAEAARKSCHNGEFLQARDSAVDVRSNARATTSDLMFRQGDPVRMTLLLERRIGACSVPISYDLTAPDGRLPAFPARAD
jgi:hypothetical protein